MTSKDLLGIIKGAKLSQCGLYRYELWRIWDKTKPTIMFLMLNPSTADGFEDDATIRKCMRYAESWGYGGIYVGNLYAYRATDRSVIRNFENPIGDDNLSHLMKLSKKCEKVVCAWGNAEGRPDYIFKNIKELHYLKLNKDREETPGHPLYLKANLTPQPFNS